MRVSVRRKHSRRLGHGRTIRVTKHPLRVTKGYRKLMKRMAPMADADKDGVPNAYDCKPFNRRKQDIKDWKWQTARTGLSLFDDSLLHPTNPHRHHDIRTVKMPVREYVSLQLTRQPALREKDVQMQDWVKDVEKGEQEDYKSGYAIDAPVLEFDPSGKLTDWQEGYRRGKLAEMKGEKELPVFIAQQRGPHYGVGESDIEELVTKLKRQGQVVG